MRVDKYDTKTMNSSDGFVMDELNKSAGIEMRAR